MLKLAIRHLLRQQQYSIINVLGLALGISTGFILAGYVYFESTFDNYHPDSNRIYRVTMHQISATGSDEYYASTYSPIGLRMAEQYPEIEDYVRTVVSNAVFTSTSGNNQATFNEDHVYYASSSFFAFFDVPIINGDQKGSLLEMNTIYLSASASKKYFGDANPIGKTLTRNHTEDYVVKGVYEDFPQNTHLNADFILPYIAYRDSDEPDTNLDENWNWWGSYFCYLKLGNHTDPTDLESKLGDFMISYKGDTWKERGYRFDLELQPLSQLHFGLGDGKELVDDTRTIRKSNLMTIGLIAIFVLVVAWINYINLTTAQTLLRGKEVGIRKILGAGRATIARLFMAETLLLNGAAMVVAITLTTLMLPFIIDTIGLPMIPANFFNTDFIVAYVTVLIFGALLAGYYPTLIARSSNVVRMLRDSLSTSPGGNRFRYGLIVFQFACTVFLITGTIGVYKQIKYMQSQDLGVNIESKITFTAPLVRDSSYDSRVNAMLTSLLAQSNIKAFTSSSTVPGMPHKFRIGGVRRLNSSSENASHYSLSYIDGNYLDFFNLQLVAGSNLDDSTPADNDHVLITESAARLLGYSSFDEAIGDQIVIPRGTVTVKGIVRDYHNISLKSDFEPAIFRFRSEGFKDHHSVSLASGTNVNEVLPTIENEWKRYFPHSPFNYFEIKSRYQQQYKTETDFAALVLVFSCVAIFIACMGLYSVASFNLIREQKNTAIRKVLGASVKSLVLTHYRKYGIMITIAIGISVPAGIYTVQTWVERFASQMPIQLDILVAPAVIILVITGITITGIVTKAALANPVEVIRKE
ncbi:MAG TPA: ABC transporter permease [Cyclobacteriaceae bacterium]|nr:ABC transporter permease [Cyclobacteriaceae bacterium]